MPASLQVCVPCMLHAEYAQKSLKGGISVRLQISFRIRPARLLLNESRMQSPDRSCRACRAGVSINFSCPADYPEQ